VTTRFVNRDLALVDLHGQLGVFAERCGQVALFG